jgi:hypothetical protein
MFPRHRQQNKSEVQVPIESRNIQEGLGDANPLKNDQNSSMRIDQPSIVTLREISKH